MLKPLIIQRYVFKEMVAPFCLSLAVATFILLLAKIMELTDLVVTRGVGLDVVLRLLYYVMPYFLVFTVPMATLLGVLLGFMRMSVDNEVTALKAAGGEPHPASALGGRPGPGRLDADPGPGHLGPALGAQPV